MNNIRVGITGGAGYTGGELIRLLLQHPSVEIVFIHSKSNAGNPVYQVHQDLFGQTELFFSASLSHDIDVLFLCLGHGDSEQFLKENPVPENIGIIDLSQDFRDETHGYTYGLPELKREKIKHKLRIANPGCFATTIQLGLLPAVKAGLIKDEVHINAITGSTGAGQKPRETTHFSWRDNNVSAYKVFAHQHLREINQNFARLNSRFNQPVNFVPWRGDFTKGIYASIYFNSDIEGGQLAQIYNDFYQSHPFTHVCPFEPALKMVQNTNNCFVNARKIDNKVFVISCIDNLIKGAGGQAIQNMNLMFGLDESSGLKLKPSVF